MASAIHVPKGNQQPNESMNKAKEAGSEAVDKAKEAGNQTLNAAKEMGGQVVDKAKEMGNQVVDKAKEMGAQAVCAAKDAVGSVGDMASQAASNVGKKADNITASAGHDIRKWGDALNEKGPQGGFMGHASHAVAETLQESGHYLEDAKLSGMADDVGKLVKRHPVPALLIGFGVGFMLGRALRS
jgi:cell division septum initiation protein DivIVA